MIEMDWLVSHMQHSDRLAQWLYEQFSYEYAGQSLDEWQAEFADGQTNGDWLTLIAHEHGQLLGSAALATNDLQQRADLGPWLACVYVAPHARGRGLAAELVARICATAQAQGVERLYLHTHDRRDYYAARGWTALESFQAWGSSHCLMARDLR
ncbi:GNAT family N-acetyltransferase [Pseudomonas sp. J237]|nr:MULTISPECIES: GNAT family N-acetyltransferase [Pseudomonas]OEO25565.1 GNAT family N-acetyltransferase [Pseudomonas sp. J237]